MKNTLRTSEIVAALLSDDYAKWTHEAAQALAEYLEEYEQDCDIELELDVVALRCTYSEYDSLEDWITEYYSEDIETAFKSAGVDLEGDESNDERDELIRSHILDQGHLIEFSGGIIVSEF